MSGYSAGWSAHSLWERRAGGSNPSTRTKLGDVAQMDLERLPTKQKVAGSSPAIPSKCFTLILLTGKILFGSIQDVDGGRTRLLHRIK